MRVQNKRDYTKPFAPQGPLEQSISMLITRQSRLHSVSAASRNIIRPHSEYQEGIQQPRNNDGLVRV